MEATAIVTRRRPAHASSLERQQTIIQVRTVLVQRVCSIRCLVTIISLHAN